MSPFAIVAVCVLAIFIIGLLVFIIKTTMTPKKVESIPKLIKQGKTQNAIKLAKQILAKDPKNFIAHYYLGKAYLKENKSELAIIEYKLVNENALFGPQLDELSFRQEYAQLLMKYNQLQEALKNYLLLTKLDPKNPENFYNAGYLYEQANRYDLAMGFMQKTVMLNTRHAKAHAEIGLMHYRTKNFGEAKKEIDIAIKLSPETYSSYYYLGKIEKDAKDLAAAIKSFEKAQRDPEIKQKAIIEHGSCFMLANRFDNAAMDFQRAIELDKENLKGETLYARYFLATCYEKSRQIEKAIEQWEQIYKRNKAFRDVSAKLSEYKDLQANDYLKDYLTCSNDEFVIICKNAVEKSLKHQVVTCDLKKWGCQITGVDKSTEGWRNMRKQVTMFRFFREPDPVEDDVVRETQDTMKAQNCQKCYLFSSSGYSNTAKHFAEGRPIELIDKIKLESVLSKADSSEA
ncbi:MAG: tetratricopeptide repeat protein [Treponema sp.]|nr:tetratricopeptide repeat protein [Treponema sp.]